MAGAQAGAEQSSTVDMNICILLTELSRVGRAEHPCGESAIRLEPKFSSRGMSDEVLWAVGVGKHTPTELASGGELQPPH